ncbi:uncharacterized protein J7T54_005081 [Emericellopsis cladophorae]|uniref:Uncharacterized protein n=1 Tax=Emericellopsis cladophorae TaxID=2686198 RepID=A0A9P9Y1Q1_9HYPO|nr:uncharacterized protein J7T54_005081 [Emericellopsis cladophorae]KAI6781871.1 hypothetical protein J7T54_005081 [Emericellopsis cladophorae]
MPFFGNSRHATQPEPTPEPAPRKGLFHRSEPEPAPITHEPPKKHGLFNRRGSSPSPPPAAGRYSMSSRSSMSSSGRHSMNHSRHSKTNSGLLSKFGRDNNVDPSIANARDQVESAEQAEIEADRALDAARMRVRDARAQVKILEEEAREEARRAKVKQHHAKDISKRGKGLGRHG